MRKVILIAPWGEGVGGIIGQTNALLGEFRKQKLIEVYPIDSTQRYRKDYDLRLTSRLKGGARQMLQLVWAFFVTARKVKPEAVHLRSSASIGLVRDVVLSLMGRLLGLRVYVSFHFGRIPELKTRRNWEWCLLKLVCRVANGVVVLDQRSKAALVSALPKKRIEQLPNGIDMAWIKALHFGQGKTGGKVHVPCVVFAGMLLPAKGVVELVKACSMAKGIPFELQMVGPVGPEMKAELCSIAQLREGGKWLSFTGALSREETVKAIASGDIFALPSHTEGFPNVVLEAMGCGKPVISTPVGAITEMLSIDSSQPAGICVPVQDVPALQAAVERLVGNPDICRAMGNAGREKCLNQYDLADVTRRYASLWTEADPN